jgi:hypothetical protein
MLKKSIKPGHRIIFAQSYLSSHPYHKFLNLTGTVSAILTDNHVSVNFDAEEEGLSTLVFVEDLELLPEGQPEENDCTVEKFEDTPVADVSLEEVVSLSDTELAGMSKSQLVALKLQAQEYDPELDKKISNLLTE